MTKTYSVASVTVASNAAHRLPRQLDALTQQSRKLDEIIVVDNASSDGTADMLAARYPEVTVLSLHENGGVGGGYAAGLTHAAIAKRHAWTWLLDDDSVPAPEGLQKLLEGLQYLTEATARTAILAPLCVNLKTSMSYPGLSWQGGRLVPTPGDPGQPLTFVDSVISSGSLIRREAVEAVGLPRVDFFIDFVDHEYCLRLGRSGFRIAVVRDSILDHEIGAQTTINILGRKKFWADHDPWREYYMARNETFTIWQHYPQPITKGFVVYKFAHHALGIVLFGKQKLSCLGMMCRGFMDGRAGRLGIRFLPEKREQAKPYPLDSFHPAN
jgi:rhamnopyranosyl-N-acetylglucosaminyl-diphospho-decaprenol beta-1,3/1,4-galactofuranosyltransferase